MRNYLTPAQKKLPLTLLCSAIMTFCLLSPAVSNADQAYAPFNLNMNEAINDGPLWLVMQSDGNLVLYNTDYNQAVWYSNTGGRSCSAGCSAAFQSDGNLVLYEGGNYYWNTGTWFSGVSALALVNRFPYFIMYSTMASEWGVVPHGNLVEPNSGTVLADTISFR